MRKKAGKVKAKEERINRQTRTRMEELDKEV